VSIPFRASGGDGSLVAGFVRIIRDNEGFDGALFIMSPNGEPLEFVFSRVNTPRTILWRAQDLKRRAAHELVASLFNVTTSHPTVVFAKADEVDPGFFASELITPVCTCRVAHEMASVDVGADEHGEDLEGVQVHLVWSAGKPDEGSPERILVDKLQSAGLLTEPFDRAEAGLREARGGAVRGPGTR
jgi:hypothetical protein